MRNRTFLVIALLLSGCGYSNLPEYSRLDKLRVLALIPNQPEVAAGSVVRIRPLVSDMNGKGRGLKYFAEACLDPGVGLGAEPTCNGNETRVSYADRLPVSGLSERYHTGIAPSFDVVVPPAALVFIGRTDAEKYNGVSYLVTYTIQDEASQDTVKAFKRIIVSTKSQKNSNPTLKDVFADGSTLNRRPTNGSEFLAQIDQSSAEPYVFKKSEGIDATGEEQKTESLTVTWTSNDGKFKRTRTEPTISTWFDPPSVTPEQGGLIFVVILRDDRGGVSYKILEL